MKRKALLLGSVMALAGTAQAADVTWKETPADSNFANTANWSADPSGQNAYLQGTNAPSASLASAITLNRLYIANSANTTGTLEVKNGAALTVSDILYIGVSGTAAMNITGGTVSTRDIFTADAASGNATVTISNATLNASAGTTFGCRGTSVLNVNEGAVLNFTAGGGTRHYVGRISGTSTMNINGGEVNIKNDGANYAQNGLWYIGDTAKGIVNMNAGTVNGYQIYMADQSSGNAEFNLSGGTVNMKDVVIVGTRGKAVLNVSGGTLDAKSIYVSYGAHTSSNAAVTQTGGTVTLASGVFYGAQEKKAVGTYELSGGKLIAPTVKYGNTNTTASFSVSGTGEAVISGAVEVPATLSGGTLQAGSITNTLTQSGGFLVPGGVGEYGTTTITGTYLAELTNVARSKPTSQVSLYQDGTRFFPSEVVDGNTGNFNHTDPSSGKNQWWQVMFSENDMPIESVKLYNRNLDGSTARRLTDNGCGFHFELYSGTLENPGEMIAKSETYTAETWTQGKELALDFAEDGNILRVVRDFADGYSPASSELVLSLAEVEIYASDAGIQMDIAADGLSDKILIGDGGSMDISNAFLDIMIDDISAVAPGTEWKLFETSGSGTLTGDFLFVTLNDAALGNGWEFANGILSFNGASSQVPEPGTMVLLALGLGGLFLMRRKR